MKKKKPEVSVMDCTTTSAFTEKVGGGYGKNIALTEFLREVMCSSW